MDGLELILQELQKINQRLDLVDQRLESVDQRFDAVDQRFDAVDQRFGSVDQRLDAVDARFTQHREELLHDMQVLLDTEVTTKFNLLLERQDDFLSRVPNEDDMAIIDERLHDLEVDVAMLKAAN